MLKNIIIFIFFILFIANVDGFYAPNYHIINDSYATISYSNLTPVAEPVKVYFRSMSDAYWDSKTASYDGDYDSTINLPIDDVYEFYIKDDLGRRFPNGTNKLIISKNDSYFLSKSLEFSNNQQTNIGYCRPYLGVPSFSCTLGNMQVDEALRFAYAYKNTGNLSYKNISLELVFSEYYSQVPYKAEYCDHTKNDFNCSLADGFFGYQATGALRQGDIIHSLMEISRIFSNDTIKDLAEQYALGTAGECDVWNSDFDCGDSASQGSMILGYWTAYEMTGKAIYSNIAESLTNQGLSSPASPLLLLGLSKSYGLTNNSAFYQKMISVAESLLFTCTDTACSPQDQAMTIKAFFDVFRQTGDHRYLKAATDSILVGTSSDCDPNAGDFICSTSEQQGLLNQAWWIAYQTMVGQPTFHNPVILNKPTLDKTLNLSILLNGYIDTPELVIIGPNELSWNHILFNYWDSNLSIPADNLSDEGVYSYYFNSSNNIRFPKNNGTLKFTISSNNIDLDQITDNLRDSDPLLMCDPHGTDTSLKNFSCRNEYFQGWMISSFWMNTKRLNKSQEGVKDNLTFFMESLGSTKIDDYEDPLFLGDRRSTCESVLHEYSCKSFPEYAADPYRKPGGVRQAMQILSYLNLYSITEESDFRKIAIRYLENQSDSCLIWDNDFDCNESQGFLAYAFWKAYEILGGYDSTAASLTDMMLDDPVSEYAELSAISLWKGYSLTGNVSYLLKAKEMTDYFFRNCTVSGECDVETFGLNTFLMWEAASTYSKNTSYLQNAMQKSLLVEPSDLNTCNPQKSIFSCKTPSEQGILGFSYANAALGYYNSENVTLKINMETQNLVNYQDNFSLSCIVNNTGKLSASYSLFLVNGGMTIENISTTGTIISDTRIDFSGHPSLQKINTTWTINADIGGPTDVKCVILPAFVNETEVIVNNLTNISELILNPPYLIEKGEQTNISFQFHNTQFFTLYNVTINASIYNKTKTIKILNISGSDEYDNESITISRIYSNQTAVITIELNSSENEDNSIIIESSTGYGGYTGSFFDIYSFENKFNITSLEIPQISTVNQVFNTSITISNDRIFNLTNLTIGIIKTGSLQDPLSISVTGASSVAINTTHIMIESLEYQGNVTVVWELVSSNASNSTIQMGVVSGYPFIQNTTEIFNIETLTNVFNISSSILPNSALTPPKNTLVEFLFSANITNMVSINLTNITAKLIVSNDTLIQVINLSTNTTNLSIINRPAMIYLQENGSDLTSLLNVTDSSSIHISNTSLNATFTLSNISGISISIKHNDSAGGPYGNYSVYLVNSSSQSLICTIPYLPNERLSTCPINGSTGSNFTIRIHVNEYINATIDSIYAEYTNSTLLVEGFKLDQNTIFFDSLDNWANVKWRLNLSIADPENITLEVLSIENGFGSVSYIFSPVSEIIEETTSSSGGGGGGGGYFKQTSKDYDYSNFLLWDELSKYPKLWGPSKYLEDETDFSRSGVSNETYKFIDCINVSRKIIENGTSLIINLTCSRMFENCWVFDAIPKTIASSLENVTIKSEQGTYKIIEKDPEILFNFKKIDEMVSFSYLGIDELQSFRPIIFCSSPEIEEAKPPSPVNNITDINETDSVGEPKTVPEPDGQTKASGEKDEKTEYQIIISKAVQFVNQKLTIILIIGGFLVLLALFFIYDVKNRIRTGLDNSGIFNSSRRNIDRFITIVFIYPIKYSIKLLKNIADLSFRIAGYISHLNYLLRIKTKKIHHSEYKAKEMEVIENENAFTRASLDTYYHLINLETSMTNLDKNEFSEMCIGLAKKINMINPITNQDRSEYSNLMNRIKFGLQQNIVNFDGQTDSIEILNKHLSPYLGTITGIMREEPKPAVTHIKKQPQIDPNEETQNMFYLIQRLSSLYEEENIEKIQSLLPIIESTKQNIQSYFHLLGEKEKELFENYLVPELTQLKSRYKE